MGWLFDIQAWEMASYIVTVVALPFAIYVFWLEQRRERQNDEEELYQKLSDEYSELQQLLLQNADLQLFSKTELDEASLTTEQRERRLIIFDLIVSLFERAYILVYEDKMNAQQRRLWASWADYMQSWCRRRDFRDSLPELLQGEDPDFGQYLREISRKTELVNKPSSKQA
jgi:hypothetical protein